MSYFGYVGRLLSNVKGFYNEINSATLTGAIDVVIVQQEDGTYLCSPFHVRFGKLGVLRSREKVVDIEINGEPVDLHMKLGESGEAFFVKELEEEAYNEIPAYLATSPIPSAEDLMEQGVRELHKQVKETEKLEQETLASETGASSDTKIVQSSDKQQQPDTSQQDQHRHSIEKSEWNKPKIVTNKQVTRLSLSGKTNKKPLNSHTSSKDSLGESDNSSKESGSREQTPVSLGLEDKKPVEECTKTKRRKKKKGPYKKTNPRLLAKSGKDPEIFDLEVTSDEEELRLPPVLPSIVKSVSLPLAEEDRMNRTNIWANSQFEAHLHPFSDTDVTPMGSPSATRCHSPVCKSDTECERQRQEDTDAANLLPPPETLWEWGQLPKPLPSPSHDTPTSNKDASETAGQQGTDVKPPTPASGGLFYFMRKTKAIRHKPEEEGIYLEDLTKEEMDPEVAKLYFPKSSFHFMSIKEKEEDTESGRGASLPQSPHSVEGAIGGPPASYLLSEVRHLGEVSVSLCGGLAETEGHISMESFMQSVVTFDTLCEDLNLVHNPDLVIRIGDKFYNWATAAPQILSLMAFHKYLPESVVQNLVKEHMPKKKERKSGMTSWFSWRRAPPHETQTTIADATGTTTTTSTLTAPVTSSEGATVITVTAGASQLSTVTTADASPPKAVSVSTSDTPSVPKSHEISNGSSSEISSQDTAAVTAGADTVTTTTTMVSTTTSPQSTTAVTATSTIETTSVAAVTAVTMATEAKPITTTAAASDGQTSLNTAVTELVTQVVEQSSKKLQSEASLSEEPISPVSSAPSSPKKPSHQSTKRLKDEDSSENETDSSDKSLSRIEVQSISSESVDVPHPKYQKSLRLSSHEIVKLNLRQGQNEITFSVTTQYQGTSRCTSHMYLWRYDDKIVISDIDGTITKSDVLGHILPILGRDWSQSGVAELYTKISNNGYKFLYLSARAIGQSKVTKDLLRNIRQDNLVLPEGPLMLSPISLISAFHREVIEKKPEEFKISCMSDIGQLFPQNQRPFYAGFGNKINDVYAYKALDIPFSRIFTINHKGELRHEKILTFQSSYQKLVDVVDHFFPPMQRIVFGETVLHSELLIPSEFRSVSYWREPLPEVSLDGLLEVKVTEPKNVVSDSAKEKK